MENWLVYNFYLTLALVAFNVALYFAKRTSMIKFIGLLAVLSAFAGYISIIISSGHFPASGDFEKYTTIVFVLTLTGTINLFRPAGSPKTYIYWIVALVFMAYVTLFPLEAGQDYFMYHNPWVVMFFQFRIISIAIISYALSVNISFLLTDENTRSVLLQRTRNFTLLGAVVFLSGEFCGSYWSWIGWGDPWRWSRGFFLATAMFILAIATSHLPASIISSDKKRSWYSTILLFLIIIVYNI